MTSAIRAALAAGLAASLAASCGPAPPMRGNRYDFDGSREEFDQEIRRANPSRVVAAELAFARAAQDKGQWTAFAEYATDDAVMFVPEPVNAQQWLKGRANPPQAVRWQPHQVWSSCDGSLAVTKGAWQRPDGSVGYFTTVWQRQDDGEYKWVMDQGDVLAEPLQVPEMIEAKSADCHGASSIAMPLHVRGTEDHWGSSTDGTLSWLVKVWGDGRRVVNVIAMIDGEPSLVVDSTVEPPPSQ